VDLSSTAIERLLNGADERMFAERLPEVGHARARARVTGSSWAVMKIVGIGTPSPARRC
jgi:hypothetical protein